MHLGIRRARTIGTTVAACLTLGLGVDAALAQGSGGGVTIADLLRLASVSANDLSPDGRWLVVTISTTRDRFGSNDARTGDPTYDGRFGSGTTYVVDTKTGARRAILPPKEVGAGWTWSPDGTLLAFNRRRDSVSDPFVWELASGKLRRIPLPAATYPAAAPRWLADGRLALQLRSDKWRKETRAFFDSLTTGPIVVMDSKDPFLAWESLSRRASIRSLAVHDLKADRTEIVFPEASAPTIELTEDGQLVRYHEDITKGTDYGSMAPMYGGDDHRVLVRPTAGGTPRVVLAGTKRLTVAWAKDGRHFATIKDSTITLRSVDDSTPRSLVGSRFMWDSTLGFAFIHANQVVFGSHGSAELRRFPIEMTGRGETPPDPADTSKDARAKRDRLSLTPARFSKTGAKLLLTGRDGVWMYDSKTGAHERIVAFPAAERPPEAREEWRGPEPPSVRVAAWSPDEDRIYLAWSSSTVWDNRVLRYDVSSKKLVTMMRDSAQRYGSLQLSDDGGTIVYTMSDGNRAGDLYAADADGSNPRRLTDANPWLKERRFGATELINYLDADGKRLNGVLFYPVGYEKGKRYPTVFHIYERQFSDNLDNETALLTANGYVVVKPSVDLEIGFPGEAWLKGVTAAANKVIEMGITDSARLGVHGTSYGGYATNLLITQTSRFKAAINISGKTDMISFYTDSPRIGVRNIWAPEGQQDRLGATLWQQPHKYVAHSAIMFADRIKTPLLLITGEQDHNVPARTTSEMYYALRRLGKPVVWVNYMNGGHGTPYTNETEWTDYYTRILGWYDKHLKADDAKVTTGN